MTGEPEEKRLLRLVLDDFSEQGSAVPRARAAPGAGVGAVVHHYSRGEGAEAGDAEIRQRNYRCVAGEFYGEIHGKFHILLVELDVGFEFPGVFFYFPIGSRGRRNSSAKLPVCRRRILRGDSWQVSHPSC